MADKKIHEVSRLAPLIHQLYTNDSCNVVADIGCGLGYLGHIVSQEYNAKVIGFELKESNCQGASKKLRQANSDNLPSIHQLQFDESVQCQAKLLEVISSEPGSNSDIQRICLVGLHCCGDLTPMMLNQFCQIDSCKTLVCMGCCYHRMLPSKSKKGYERFPLSRKLEEIFDVQSMANEVFNGFALRLACQETAARWVCIVCILYLDLLRVSLF